MAAMPGRGGMVAGRGRGGGRGHPQYGPVVFVFVFYCVPGYLGIACCAMVAVQRVHTMLQHAERILTPQGSVP